MGKGSRGYSNGSSRPLPSGLRGHPCMDMPTRQQISPPLLWRSSSPSLPPPCNLWLCILLRVSKNRNSQTTGYKNRPCKFGKRSFPPCPPQLQAPAIYRHTIPGEEDSAFRNTTIIGREGLFQASGAHSEQEAETDFLRVGNCFFN